MRLEIDGLRAHINKESAQKSRLDRLTEINTGSLPRSPTSRNITVCLNLPSELTWRLSDAASTSDERPQARSAESRKLGYSLRWALTRATIPRRPSLTGPHRFPAGPSSTLPSSRPASKPLMGSSARSRRTCSRLRPMSTCSSRMLRPWLRPWYVVLRCLSSISSI